LTRNSTKTFKVFSIRKRTAVPSEDVPEFSGSFLLQQSSFFQFFFHCWISADICMGNGLCRHHEMQEIVYGPKLDIGHLIQDFLYRFLNLFMEKHFPCAGQRTVSRKKKPVSGNIRIKPYSNSSLFRNMGSKGSCHIKAPNILHFQSYFSHHIFYNSPGCGFCLQKLFYILLEEKEAGPIFGSQFSFYFPDFFRSFLHITASYINPAIEKHDRKSVV